VATLPSKSPINALQKVVVARLKGDSALVALLANRAAVYDQPPEGDVKPYVRVGDFLSTPDNTHDTIGRNIVMTLHIWTKRRGNKEGQDIAARIVELLDHQTAVLDPLLQAEGHKMISIRNEFDQSLTDPDPEIRHHVLRFRVATAQLS
jgi:hypothetical protein